LLEHFILPTAIQFTW